MYHFKSLSKKMKNQMGKDIVPFSADKSLKGIVSISNSQHYASPKFRRSNSVIVKMNKLGQKIDSLTRGIREHVRIASKISDTVKGKLSLGGKILQVGGVKKVFEQSFSVKEGEKLLKVSQCYLSTTAGPLAGLLFISTDKLAYCSERSIKISTSTGDFLRVHYRVVIPLGKIHKARESENVKQPSRKYIEIATKDNFEFWFMGFLSYRRTMQCIQNALAQAE